MRSPAATPVLDAMDASVGAGACSGRKDGCGIVASGAADRGTASRPPAAGNPPGDCAAEDADAETGSSPTADCRIQASQSRNNETIKTINKIERRVSITKLTFDNL
jgi:hypothetical protein